MTGMREKLIVVTDLDGTLLDDSYRWDAAAESVEELRRRGFPLVLNSSKTLAEMRDLARELETVAPLVAENGGVVAVPEESGLAEYCGGAEKRDGYLLNFPGTSRERILEVAHGLRAERGYRFEGFADWPVETIVGHTGLSAEQAGLSARRVATEPIHWHDSEDRLAEFSELLGGHGIRILRGGRFLHLMGMCDKAGGLREVAKFYRLAEPGVAWTTMALGDSANDLGMLNAADIAVVIPNLHGGPLLKPEGGCIFTATKAGPEGWHEALSHFLEH